MILQSLCEYYDELAKRKIIPPVGWIEAEVSFAITLDSHGSIQKIVSLEDQDAHGMTTQRKLNIPERVKRSSNIIPYFLCDKAEYLLGITKRESDEETEKVKNKEQKAKAKFEQSKKLHQKILCNFKDIPAINSLLLFFEHWDPVHPSELVVNFIDKHTDFFDKWIIFEFDHKYLNEYPEVKEVWNNYYGDGVDSKAPKSVSLISGKRGPIAKTHPPIQGVFGSQASGANIISFNQESFCSYGKEQNLNAPVTKLEAIKYTAALNYLLKQKTSHLGDSTIVFWAKNGKEQYQEFFLNTFLSNQYSDSDLKIMIDDLCKGQMVEFHDEKLSPDMDFYILILTPNSSRLSIRYFTHNSFGSFIRNINKHYERTAIYHNNKNEYPSLVQILVSTKRENSDNTASYFSELLSEMIWCILNNKEYPALLLNSIEIRIHANRNITWIQAAALKAYYLKRPNKYIHKEDLTVSLNKESTNTAYNLGRLFAILEKIQKAANPSTTSTIRDKYFDSASSTPSRIFPNLLKLSQKHLAKLDYRIYFDKQIQEVLEKFDEKFPNKLTLPEQGSFQLGYYHQLNSYFSEKEEK